MVPYIQIFKQNTAVKKIHTNKLLNYSLNVPTYLPVLEFYQKYGNNSNIVVCHHKWKQVRHSK